MRLTRRVAVSICHATSPFPARGQRGPADPWLNGTGCAPSFSQVWRSSARPHSARNGHGRPGRPHDTGDLSDRCSAPAAAADGVEQPDDPHQPPVPAPQALAPAPPPAPLIRAPLRRPRPQLIRAPRPRRGADDPWLSPRDSECALRLRQRWRGHSQLDQDIWHQAQNPFLSPDGDMGMGAPAPPPGAGPAPKLPPGTCRPTHPVRKRRRRPRPGIGCRASGVAPGYYRSTALRRRGTPTAQPAAAPTGSWPAGSASPVDCAGNAAILRAR